MVQSSGLYSTADRIANRVLSRVSGGRSLSRRRELVGYHLQPEILSGTLLLTVHDVITLMLENSLDLRIDRMSPLMSRYSVASTFGRFEPSFHLNANLFVPFFTTKPGGSGIGLVLSRQIAEAHGGSLRLDNRNDSRGCVASFRLPLRTA